MEWLEAEITTAPEGIEPLSGLLLECGVSNLQIKDDAEFKKFLIENPLSWDYVDDELLEKSSGEASVVFYLTADPAGFDSLALVEERLAWLKGEVAKSGEDYGALSLNVLKKDDILWVNEWKKYYKPFKAGGIVIRPEWEPYEKEPGELVLTLNPGHAFGTGLHQTTQLCLEQLKKNVFKDCRVLDIGCGSGILSIAALLLGASEVLACELDPAAAFIAIDNASLNNIPARRMTVLSGNAITDQNLRQRILDSPKADIVVSNIVADARRGLADLAWLCLKPGGIFISSGIISQRLDDVLEALESAGFELVESCEKDDWRALAVRHA
jgi:ribosomal protein L11 methyltransferase